MLNEKNEIIKFIKNLINDLDLNLDEKTNIIEIILKQIFDKDDNLIEPVEPMTLVRMFLAIK